MAAFECFDERDEGKIDAGELRYWLGEVGDRMQDEEVSAAALCNRTKCPLTHPCLPACQQIDRLLSGPFMDRGGRNFDYKACEF